MNDPLTVEELKLVKLNGKYKHLCVEWDYMAIDETCPEFDTCLCFNNKPMRNEL